MSRTAAVLVLLAILIAYLAIGVAYALNTPPWQNPDEPAHYNYIKFIAENKSLPILQPGDYDQPYNDEFKRTPQNTQSLPIDPLRYENYAPPLYYLLGAPIYALTDGWLVALRLFSVILGAGLIVVAYLIGVEMFPSQLHLASGTAAFVAFVPQHVAMLAAVNNDSLAELLIAVIVLQSMRLFRSPELSQRQLFSLGITLGLGLLTKASVYYTAVPVAFMAVLLHARAHQQSSRVIRHWSLVFVPARHNEVVIGQPTTAQWIAQYGFGGLLARGLTTTFHSFWGQFGWMAVPMPDSTYLLLGLLSIIAVSGWGWRLIERMKDEGGGMKRPSSSAILLSLLALLTFGGFIWYNLTFVQYQGRYLFPALIPIGLVFAIGIDHWLSQLKSMGARLISRSQRDWTPWLDEAQLIIFALVFILLARLDLIALGRYITPALSP